jgi:hypothetical protein
MSLKSNSPSSLSDDGLVGYKSYLKNPNRKKNEKENLQVITHTHIIIILKKKMNLIKKKNT